MTIDIGIDHFATAHRRFTIVDAPGHRDFIPNMISGSSQADTALLVVDAGTGAFESGFNEGGQTREHILLVRSFGVQQLVVAINKLDSVSLSYHLSRNTEIVRQVAWSQDRYSEIVELLKPFLSQSGFNLSKVAFVPCGAMLGENLAKRQNKQLASWYGGQTVVEALGQFNKLAQRSFTHTATDALDVPKRPIESPLRLPVSNVFKNQSGGISGVGVSGRIESGIVQVGDSLAVQPGDATCVVKGVSSS